MIKCLIDNIFVDNSISFDLGKVAYPFQKTIGNSWCLSGTLSNFFCTRRINFDIQNFARPFDNLLDIFIVIKFQSLRNSKAIQKRRRNQINSGGGTNQGEFWKIEPDGSGRWTFANYNIESIIFHGWIEYFFDEFIQSMNLVDEQNISVFHIGKYCSQVSNFFNSWTRSDFDILVHFIGNQIGQSCFT